LTYLWDLKIIKFYLISITINIKNKGKNKMTDVCLTITCSDRQPAYYGKQLNKMFQKKKLTLDNVMGELERLEK